MASPVGANRACSRSSGRTKSLPRLAILATVAALVLLTACGQGDDPPASATAAPTEGTPITCRPAGDEIAVVAEGSAFDKDCLAATANQPFTIRLDNRDSLRHNIEIYSIASDGPEMLFHGPMFIGPKTRTFDVDALPAGTYYFDCQAHTGMGGTFIVE
jgi:plastocyanin